MGEAFVVTASWTDNTLVEIDSTYYTLPAEQTAQLWADPTPQGFVFEGLPLFTAHQAQATALPAGLRKALPPGEKLNFYYRDLTEEVRRALWQRFRSGLEPLRRSGKAPCCFSSGARASSTSCIARACSTDDARINVEQEHEIRYWSEKFRVSQDQLRSAVAKVGPMVKNVRDHLRLRD